MGFESESPLIKKMHNIRIRLEELGYDTFFDSAWTAMSSPHLSVARVIAEYKEAYKVKNENGEYFAKVTGRHVFNAKSREDFPAVGDWVVIETAGENPVIQHILPRKTVLKKKYSNKQDRQLIAANIDLAFIVEALDRDYNLNRLERYLVLVQEGKIRPVIVLNKIDLIGEPELNDRLAQVKARFPEIDVVLASTIREQGLEQLKTRIVAHQTCCFVGSSGVGKSSLINQLLGEAAIATREVSDSTGRGKHTTTARSLYFLKEGGIVIDNPGIREVGIADANSGLKTVFEDINALSKSCKFKNCTHAQEPGCIVRQAVAEQALDAHKLKHFFKLKKEAEYYEMTDLEKREKDRKFGKFVKGVKADLKQYKMRKIVALSPVCKDTDLRKAYLRQITIYDARIMKCDAVRRQALLSAFAELKAAVEGLQRARITVNFRGSDLIKYYATQTYDTARLLNTYQLYRLINHCKGSPLKRKPMENDRLYAEYFLFGFPIRGGVTEAGLSHMKPRLEELSGSCPEFRDFGRGLWGYEGVQTLRVNRELDYHKSRPIYGVLNYREHKNGGAPNGQHYGGSHFVLSDSVKVRTTFTLGDSWDVRYDLGAGPMLFTRHNFDLLIQHDPTYAIRNYFKAADHAAYKDSEEYIEAQIFGMVKFNRDIERVVISKHDLDEVGAQAIDAARKDLDRGRRIIWEVYDEETDTIAELPILTETSGKAGDIFDMPEFAGLSLKGAG